ncbi:hypothetical protein B0E33_16905 [Roseibium algicola]|uniref:Uncharacterized protein n=1 Tax=Roseibium algicola TaxID=2857014 RepID=A0ABM6I3T4_9HYPH|nr:hypothetical protein B0E33_16905 [Roseibium aggregatum]
MTIGDSGQPRNTGRDSVLRFQDSIFLSVIARAFHEAARPMTRPGPTLRFDDKTLPKNRHDGAEVEELKSIVEVM